MNLIPGTFTIEGTPESTFNGFYDPSESWNGFKVPFFTMATAIQVAQYGRNDEEQVSAAYDEEKDCFIVTETDGAETYRQETAAIDSEHGRLFEVFTGWTWSVMDAESPTVESVLCDLLETYCKAQGLPFLSADELAVHEGVTIEQSDWLYKFAQLWESSEI